MATMNSMSNAALTAGDAATDNPASATQTTDRIDPAASRVAFAIRNRLFFVKWATVTGRFPDVEGTIIMDEEDPFSDHFASPDMFARGELRAYRDPAAANDDELVAPSEASYENTALTGD